MLTHLSVQNFATVTALEMEPEGGLTVITGETGAGKSVIMQALGLALGARADAAMVREGSKRAEVRACFDVAGNDAARDWLAEQELDGDGEECILRRVVRADGRSRAWINGSPAPLQQVRELGERLVSIHSQHEHQALLRREAQRELLDSYAGATGQAREVRRLWQHYQQARRAHGEALDNARAGREREELLRFQLEELEALAPREGEVAELEAEQKRLANAESLIRLCQGSLETLYQGEQGTANDQLAQVTGWLGEAGEGDPSLQRILDTVESARLQVEAAAEDLRHYLDGLDLDPQRLSEVEQRLDALHSLARKHRVRTEALPEHQRQLEEEHRRLTGSEETLAELEQAEREAREAWEAAARELSRQRHSAASRMARGVMQHLEALGMGGACLDVALEDCEPGPDGGETVTFLFSANADQTPRPMARIASGGELSRISLAIQVICARALTVPALVFDEVDVGVGGGIAEIVGHLLRELGEHAQVLCITHQPQVAAQGRHHWHVLKEQAGHTRTEILPLRDDDRVREVARMLGGVEMTDSTLAHAKEMVERAAARQ